LRDIRTRSGRVDRDDPLHGLHEIGSLEMEKARREKEKSSAEFGSRNIDMRLAEIEAEKDATLKSLGERKQEVLQGLRKRGTKSQDVSTKGPAVSIRISKSVLTARSKSAGLNEDCPVSPNMETWR